MVWAVEHRRAADRRGLRYSSDFTDAEWALVVPIFRPAKYGGFPCMIDVREVLNEVFFVLSTSCQWSALPKDLPPMSRVWAYFSGWEWESTIERIHNALYVMVREYAQRKASSTTADHHQPDSEGRSKGGSALHLSGYDAGKKVVSRKSHMLTDTIGMLVAVTVHSFSVQDRDGAEPLLRKARTMFPFVLRIIGDAGYYGPKMPNAACHCNCIGPVLPHS